MKSHLKYFMIECAGSIWSRVAKKLQADLNAIPVYWSAPSSFEKTVLNDFPHTHFFNSFDSRRGKYCMPENFQDMSLNWDHILKLWQFEIGNVNDQYCRFDLFHDFSTQDRNLLYMKHLVHGDHILNKYKPDFVFFPSAPHVGFDYVLYKLCCEKGIKTVIIDFIPINEKSYLTIGDSIEFYAKNLVEDYNNKCKLPQNGVKLREDIFEYIQRVRSKKYEDSKPVNLEYFQNQINSSLLLKNIVGAFKHVLKLLCTSFFNPNEKWQSSFYKQKGKSPPHSWKGRMGKLLFHFPFIKSSWKAKKRILEYDALCSEYDINEKYIYFSLHYQPERTSNPLGGKFYEQRLAISLLSHCIPKGWKIYVKEHPVQFMSLWGQSYRSKDFYSYLKSLGNVKFMKNTEDVFRLIDGAQATATLTGTTAMEGVLRGKPSLVFGHFWFNACHGIYEVFDSESCSKAISEIKKGVSIKQNKVELFFKSVEDVCPEGTIDPLNNQYWPDFDESKNVESIFKLLKSYLLTSFMIRE